MKRALAILVGASLAFAVGCFQAYDMRVNDTVERLRYLRDLNNNTENPPGKNSKLNPSVFLRPPKGFQRAETFTMAPIEPGRFDAAESFIDTSTQATLHVLARTPQQAATKKAKPAASRGDFTTDVVDLIKGAYSTELDAAQLKPFQPDAHGRKPVPYRSAKFDANGKKVEVYFYGAKGAPTQVALVFEGPPDSLKTTQIHYSLMSLAVGELANTRYNGNEASEEASAAAQGVF